MLLFLYAITQWGLGALFTARWQSHRPRSNISRCKSFITLSFPVTSFIIWFHCKCHNLCSTQWGWLFCLEQCMWSSLAPSSSHDTKIELPKQSCVINCCIHLVSTQWCYFYSCVGLCITFYHHHARPSPLSKNSLQFGWFWGDPGVYMMHLWSWDIANNWH